MPRPARPWFRFYSEALDSRKVAELKPALFKHWVYLLMLANISKPRGTLPGDIKDIAFALRLREPQAAEVLGELKALRFLDLHDGHFTMHDWSGENGWQYESDARETPGRLVSDADRMPGGRAAQLVNNAADAPQNRGDNAADARRRAEADTEAETDPETEAENARAPEHPFAFAFAEAYRRNHSGRPPSPTQHGEALALEREFGADACIAVAQELDWQKSPAYMRPRLEDRRNGNTQTRHPARSGSRSGATGESTGAKWNRDRAT